jgi:hypothetical protein
MRLETFQQTIEHDRVIFGVFTAVVGGMVYLILEKQPAGWSMGFLALGLGLVTAGVAALVQKMTILVVCMRESVGDGSPDFDAAAAEAFIARQRRKLVFLSECAGVFSFGGMLSYMVGLCALAGWSPLWIAPAVVVGAVCFLGYHTSDDGVVPPKQKVPAVVVDVQKPAQPPPPQQ